MPQGPIDPGCACTVPIGSSHGMSSVVTASQLYMKIIFHSPQFMATASIILVYFLRRTMSFKGRYWEMKSLVSCDDCQVLFESFKQPHKSRSFIILRETYYSYLKYVVGCKILLRYRLVSTKRKTPWM